jgi:hypothetical protein
MKPLFAAFAFIGLAAAAIFAVASCVTERLPVNQNVEVTIGDPHAIPPKYVKLKDGVPIGEPKLRVALAKLKRHGGICELTFLDHDGGTPDPHYCEKIPVSLKTDRVIKSAAANNAANANSAANDPNLMNRIAAPDPKDATGVLELLAP